MRLFGCHFRGGRAATAPLLRRTEGDHEGILAVDAVYAVDDAIELDGHRYPVVEFEGERYAEAYLHDAKVLPHLVKGDLAMLFPRVVAARGDEDELDEPDWLEKLAVPAEEMTGADVDVSKLGASSV